MVLPCDFHKALTTEGIDFFVGIPDSLLKEFCRYVDLFVPADSHIISANEGTAIGLATGHNLATGGLPLVYMQNSGLGNAINPLLSLADPEVYGIPMVLLVGWRGAPGVKDEPQHVKQGRVTLALLEALEFPYRVITGNTQDAVEAAIWACRTAKEASSPVILLAHKSVFDQPDGELLVSETVPLASMSREAALEIIISSLPSGTVIVATTGMISRELYEIRGRLKQDRSYDFLTVGSMGHASQIALGISRSKPSSQVVCLDGDGAAIMHLGGMTTIGTTNVGNLLHIVLNNGAHDSVGGQPTVALEMSLTGIARACGYDEVVGPLVNEHDIQEQIRHLANTVGQRFLELRVLPGSRKDLGRPQENPLANKLQLLGRLRG